MKKYLMLLFLAVTSCAVSAQNNSGEEPYLTKSFSAETISSVVCETSGGYINVSGVSPSESRVEVYVYNNGSHKKSLTKDEISAKVEEDYDLDISADNGKLTATARPKGKITNWKNGLTFSFKIYVPGHVATKLKTSGGNIELTGISGDQDFKTSGGNLDLESVSGKAYGKTSGGNIYLKNCSDYLDLKTSGGNIDAENSSGHIQVATSGGSIELKNLKGNIEAATSGGNIEGESIEGELNAGTSGGNVSLQGLNCSLKASTSGGNIDVSVKSLGEYLSINNSSGKVRLAIPKNAAMSLNLNADKITVPAIANFSGTMTNEKINGTINGGGTPVTVDAGSGKIYLMFD